MNCREIIKKFESLGSQKNIDGMARFGIKPKSKVFGVPVPEIRKLAKQIRKDHRLALELFDSGFHEARLLATMIAIPEEITEQQFKKWIKLFDSWDIVDQACMNLFCKSKIAVKKISELARVDGEFEKRTAFSLMAALAVHNKDMKDKDFIKYFCLIKNASNDERNFVKKAVNWALRQIGKRNRNLNKEAAKLAKEIRQLAEKNNSKSAKWIANNAIVELTGKSIQERLKF
jgi:3-methyladenine DNA glycosylase AlkD